MFTGLIREIGEVKSKVGSKLEIKSSLKPKIGDSIAINGVCLTVIQKRDNSFIVEIGSETKRVIPKEKFEKRVHLEPAMRLSDRLEGHIVQGHIDTIGEVIKIYKSDIGYELFIKVDPKYIKYIAPKGSIAIDGVSLTINEVFNDSFRVTIIPHTFHNTLFSTYKIGTKVNIETDLFARYIDHILNFKKEKNNSLSWDQIDSILMGY